MKKKLFAALAAGTMLCGMLTAPVSAEETNYQMGDVNMDGAVDVADAQIVLEDYVKVIAGLRVRMTPEQMKLASITNLPSVSWYGETYPFCVLDAQVILNYATMKSTAKRPLPDDIVTFYQNYIMPNI